MSTSKNKPAVKNGKKKFGTALMNLVKETKFQMFLLVTGLMFVTNPAMVFAAGAAAAGDSNVDGTTGLVKSVTWGNQGSISTLIGSILGMLLSIARFTGMALAIWGIVKTVMAYKDDNTNEMSQGIRLAIIGVILTVLKSILNGIGFIDA